MADDFDMLKARLEGLSRGATNGGYNSDEDLTPEELQQINALKPKYQTEEREKIWANKGLFPNLKKMIKTGYYGSDEAGPKYLPRGLGYNPYGK